jgi:[acyl-carrier-protein] S-malonyltransferase
MAEAAEAMERVLAGVPIADPAPPLLANADAQLLDTAALCRTELVDHLTAGVDWVAAVEHMRAAGVSTFVEVGPGRVLTGLIKRIAPDADALALDDPGSASTLDALLAAAPA